MGKRTGTESPCNGKEVSEELLDGWYGKPRDAQVHQVSCQMGVAEQAPFDAGQAGLHRPEVVRRGAGSVSRGFKGEILIYLILLPFMKSHKADRQEMTMILV